MNSFLMSLIGQSAGSQIGPDFLDEEERRDAEGSIVGNEIVVPGFERPRQEEGPLPPVNTMAPLLPSNTEEEKGPTPYSLQQGNFRDDIITGNAKAVALNNLAEQDTARNSERKGVFGVKGALRDILGILGDSFSGENIYMPRRQEEKWADAMAGFSDGPEAERTAIERAMRVDPERTQEFLKQSQLNRSNMGNLDLRGRELGRSEIKDLRTTLTGLAATAVTSNNPEVRAQALRIIQANSANLPADDVLRSGNLELIAGSGATPNQMLTLPLNERRVEATEANVEIARGQLGVAMRNAKSREDQVKIAREALGLRASDQQLDQFIDMLTLPGEISEQRSRVDRNNRSNTGENRSSNKTERTLKPRSNW